MAGAARQGGPARVRHLWCASRSGQFDAQGGAPYGSSLALPPQTRRQTSTCGSENACDEALPFRARERAHGGVSYVTNMPEWAFSSIWSWVQAPRQVGVFSPVRRRLMRSIMAMWIIASERVGSAS